MSDNKIITSIQCEFANKVKFGRASPSRISLRNFRSLNKQPARKNVIFVGFFDSIFATTDARNVAFLFTHYEKRKGKKKIAKKRMLQKSNASIVSFVRTFMLREKLRI